MNTFLFIIIACAVAAYLVMFSCLAFTPGKFLYQPRWESLSRLEARASLSGFSAWKNEKNELIGWKRENNQAECSYLILPGRFGMTLDRTYFVPLLEKFHNGKANTYLLEYPGFGARKGKPHEKTITAAALESANLLKQNNLPIFIIGESLGAAVGAQICAHFPDNIAGLLMVAPFDTLGDAAFYHYPLFPIKSLIVERYDSYLALAKYRGHVFFLLAGNDVTSPPILGKRLYEKYDGIKKLHIVPDIDHDGFDFSPNTEYWHTALDFLHHPTRP
ncbi:MAG: alpha/beta hydrolase [Verrucomicrobiota bacterium]